MDLLARLELAFVVWHVFAGFLGTSLVYRLRFGAFPHARWRRPRASRHRRIQAAMGVVSLAWASAVVAHFTSPAFGASPLGRPLVAPPAAVGWAIAVVGHLGMVGSQLAMGRALRVGLEETGPLAPVDLVTRGPFARSRHPVYVSSIVFLLGEWLWNPSLACALCVLLLVAGFHQLAAEEDRSLAARFGAAHEEYRRHVRRYL
ncbi:MAG: methyltransferase [bacterium]